MKQNTFFERSHHLMTIQWEAMQEQAIEKSKQGRHTFYAKFLNNRNEMVRVVDCYFNQNEGTFALTGVDVCICGIELRD